MTSSLASCVLEGLISDFDSSHLTSTNSLSNAGSSEWNGQSVSYSGSSGSDLPAQTRRSNAGPLCNFDRLLQVYAAERNDPSSSKDQSSGQQLDDTRYHLNQNPSLAYSSNSSSVLVPRASRSILPLSLSSVDYTPMSLKEHNQAEADQKPTGLSAFQNKSFPQKSSEPDLNPECNDREETLVDQGKFHHASGLICMAQQHLLESELCHRPPRLSQDGYIQKPIRPSCPSNCDQMHFHRIRPIPHASLNEAIQAGSNAIEWHSEIESVLGDLAIATSLRDLCLAIWDVLPYESSPLIKPSVLVRLIDDELDLLDFDQILLYFDQCLPVEMQMLLNPIAYSPSAISAYQGPDYLSIPELALFADQRSNLRLSTQSLDLIPDIAAPPQDKRPRNVSDNQSEHHEEKFAIQIRSPVEELKETFERIERASLTGQQQSPTATTNDTMLGNRNQATSSLRQRKMEESTASMGRSGLAMKSRKIKKVTEHICEICGKRFRRRFGLQMHWRTHSGERPYPCVICQKRFAHQSHLNRHKRTHTGERRRSCTICNRRFTENGSVIRHMKRRHPDSARMEMMGGRSRQRQYEIQAATSSS